MSNKKHLVIGGSYGIGLALVKQLVAEGGDVTVVSRTIGELQNIPIVKHIQMDITISDIPIDQLPESLDGLAYCPGSITLKPFRSLKLDDYRNDFEVNVLGAVKAIQACLKLLKKSELGSIVLFSTVAASQGMPFHASIATAKAAVEGLTKSLAAELAPKIRVNCIAPSLTNTPLAGKLLATPEKKTASDNRHPLRRVGEVDDLAATAQFLLSSKSSWITGQTIGVDGGMSTLRN